MRQLTPEELQNIIRRHRLFREAATAGTPPPADAARADLSRVDLQAADLRGANLADANCYAADLSGADLRDADLSKANLFEAKLVGAKLAGARFDSTNLRVANLTGATLPGADLRSAELTGVILENADLSHVNLSGTNFASGRMDDADFSGTVLARAHVTQCSAKGGRFLGADLSNTVLRGTFNGADFTGANLNSADLRGSFVRARFSQASMVSTDLSQCDLSGANMSAAILTPSSRQGTIVDADTTSNSGWPDEVLTEWHQAGAIVGRDNLTRISALSPALFDAEFVYAGSGDTGSHYNLYFINTSPFVLDEVTFNGAARTNVQPGERVFLRQHCVETFWDRYWSAADYHVNIRFQGQQCRYSVYISEQGQTNTRMVKGDVPDVRPTVEALRQTTAVDVNEMSDELREQTIADLRAYQETEAQEGTTRLQNLAFVLMGYFLTRVWNNYYPLVIKEIQRRIPEASAEEIEAAMSWALDAWVDAYFPN